jgi:hypothetical protein
MIPCKRCRHYEIGLCVDLVEFNGGRTQRLAEDRRSDPRDACGPDGKKFEDRSSVLKYKRLSTA